MPRVRQQRRIAKKCCEQFLAKCDRPVDVGLIEAVWLPGFLARLDDDRGEILAELVGVNLKPSEFSFLECEGECREFLRRSEPNVAALPHFDAGVEFFSLLGACFTV